LKTLWSDDLGVQSCCRGDKPQEEEVPAHFFSALHWLSPINANPYSLEQPGAAKLVQSEMMREAIGILLFTNRIHEPISRTNLNTNYNQWSHCSPFGLSKNQRI
jgi:hypothetical protein